MTKAELTEKIIDAIIDPWNDAPEDYLYSLPIDIFMASDLLNQLRDDEDKMELEPEERLPKEVTPDLVMVAYNCLIRAKKYEARTKRLADWLTDNECVCEHDTYYCDYPNNDPCVVPTDFLCNDLCDGFYFDDNVSIDDLIEIGANSKGTFSFDDTYCWYDAKKKQLFSSDTPFADGIIDAEAMARHILLDADAFGYMFDEIIDDEDAEYILGCTKEEYIHE